MELIGKTISTEPSLVRPEVNGAVDALEVALLQEFPPTRCPLHHSFGTQLYVREVFMDAGTKLTSKIHKTRHPYFVMQGRCRVWIDGEWKEIIAPHFGWTEPGTRRVLEILEPTFWITVHYNPDDTQDLEIIEERLIEKHENKFHQ